MNLFGRVDRLESAVGMSSADDFELSRPELLTAKSRLYFHSKDEDEAGRLRRMLNRHEANVIRKQGTYKEVHLTDLFSAALNGEEFCADLDAAFARAEACGL